MFKPTKTRYYLTLLQMLGILVLLSVVILLNKDWVVQFFHSTGSGQVGLVLDGMILLIFLIGLVRMILLFFGYSREQDYLLRFVKNAKDNAPNPAYNLPASSIIASRYQMVQIIARQHAPIPQAALSASLAAHQSAQMTLVRFVHNILIISGVFGTAVSLSMALMSMSGLLDSAENLQKIGGVLSGMSNTLSATVIAIICYAIFTYFYMRLMDARTQLLANVEDVTSLYIIPRFKQDVKSLSAEMQALVSEVKNAAEILNRTQNRYLEAGERLQLAADDMHKAIGQSSDNIRIIRDSVREGFRLGTEDKRT